MADESDDGDTMTEMTSVGGGGVGEREGLRAWVFCRYVNAVTDVVAVP